MSRARPYIPHGIRWQGRIEQTPLQAWEDAAGTCNTCPGELEPAERLQRERGPEPYPWRDLGLGLAVMFVAVCGASVIAALLPAAQVVATR